MAEKSAFGTTFGGMMGCLTALAVFGVIGIGGCMVGVGGCTFIASEVAKDVGEAAHESAKALEEAKAQAEAEFEKQNADAAEDDESVEAIKEDAEPSTD